MFFRRPKRFSDFLSWECFGRSVVAGLVAAAAFAVTYYFSPVWTLTDWMIAGLGIATATLDSVFRHPRFFTDFSLIRQLEQSHRQGDFKSMLQADLLIWNNQYAINFLIGLVSMVLITDATSPDGLTETLALRGGLLFGATFYLTNAVVWRMLAHNRVMKFLHNLKVDFAEQLYG